MAQDWRHLMGVRPWPKLESDVIYGQQGVEDGKWRVRWSCLGPCFSFVVFSCGMGNAWCDLVRMCYYSVRTTACVPDYIHVYFHKAGESGVVVLGICKLVLPSSTSLLPSKHSASVTREQLERCTSTTQPAYTYLNSIYSAVLDP